MLEETCILLAESKHLLGICCLCHTPHGLLAELCSLIVDLSLWLTQAQTRAPSNLVGFVTLKALFIFQLVYLGVCQNKKEG